MPIEDRLLDDEEVLGSVEASTRSGSATLYATDRRVIRVEKGLLGGERTSSLYYPHVSSAGTVSESHRLWGAGLAVAGVTILLSGYFLQDLLADLPTAFGFSWGWIFPLSLALAVPLLALGGFLCLHTRRWYQLWVPGLSSDELKNWSVKPEGREVEDFISLVNERITEFNSERSQSSLEPSDPEDGDR